MAVRKIDFLLLSYGRMGTVTVVRRLECHPKIHLEYCRTYNFASFPYLASGLQDDEKSGIVYHHYTLPTHLWEGFANVTNRELLIQTVRDPIPHYISRYNQVIFDLARATVFSGKTEYQEKFDNFPHIEDLIDQEIEGYKYFDLARRFGDFERWEIFDITDLDKNRIQNTIQEMYNAIGTSQAEVGKLSSISGFNYVWELMRIDKRTQKHVISLDLNGFEVPCYLAYADEYEFSRGRTSELVTPHLSRGTPEFELVELARSPGVATEIKFPMRDSDLVLLADRRCVESLPASVRRHLRRENVISHQLTAAILRWWIELVNTVHDYWALRKVDDLGEPAQDRFRAELHEDVQSLLQTCPKLREIWTF